MIVSVIVFGLFFVHLTGANPVEKIESESDEKVSRMVSLYRAHDLLPSEVISMISRYIKSLESDGKTSNDEAMTPIDYDVYHPTSKPN